MITISYQVFYHKEEPGHEPASAWDWFCHNDSLSSSSRCFYANQLLWFSICYSKWTTDFPYSEKKGAKVRPTGVGGEFYLCQTAMPTSLITGITMN